MRDGTSVRGGRPGAMSGRVRLEGEMSLREPATDDVIIKEHDAHPKFEVSGGVNLDRQAYPTWDQAREAALQHATLEGVDVWSITLDGMRLVRKFRTSS